jgi:hypothetical protein
LLFATFASAQALLAQPDITVLHTRWRLEVRDRSLDADPFQANKDREQEDRQQRSIAQINENRIRMGEPTLPPPTAEPVLNIKAPEISAVYIYEVKTRNTGLKEVRSITWEYIFFDRDTARELGRRRFVSNTGIRAGATKQLIARSPSPPTGTVDAKKGNKSARALYSEQVVITRIEYADGTVWTAGR